MLRMYWDDTNRGRGAELGVLILFFGLPVDMADDGRGADTISRRSGCDSNVR